MVDCARSGNYGCRGGTPHAAFSHVKLNGIAFNDNYTYVGNVRMLFEIEKIYSNNEMFYFKFLFFLYYTILSINDTNVLIVCTMCVRVCYVSDLYMRANY